MSTYLREVHTRKPNTSLYSTWTRRDSRTRRLSTTAYTPHTPTAHPPSTFPGDHLPSAIPIGSQCAASAGRRTQSANSEREAGFQEARGSGLVHQERRRDRIWNGCTNGLEVHRGLGIRIALLDRSFLVVSPLPSLPSPLGISPSHIPSHPLHILQSPFNLHFRLHCSTNPRTLAIRTCSPAQRRSGPRTWLFRRSMQSPFGPTFWRGFWPSSHSSSGLVSTYAKFISDFINRVQSCSVRSVRGWR